MREIDDRRVAVVFDVDGTLVDSERDGHRGGFNAALAASGLPYRWNAEGYGRLSVIARRGRPLPCAGSALPATARTDTPAAEVAPPVAAAALLAPASPGGDRTADGWRLPGRG